MYKHIYMYIYIYIYVLFIYLRERAFRRAMFLCLCVCEGLWGGVGGVAGEQKQKRKGKGNTSLVDKRCPNRYENLSKNVQKQSKISKNRNRDAINPGHQRPQEARTPGTE